MAAPLGVLHFEVIERVKVAYETGEPISVQKGPGYDRRLVSAFDLKGLAHVSIICGIVKQLLGSGVLRTELSEKEYPLTAKGRHLKYKKVIFLPID